MRYARRRTGITYEGLSFLSILAFIVLGSILRQINLLVLLSGLMIAPFFFNWRISRKMLQQVRFTRKVPAWVHAGVPARIQWQVHNDRPRIPAWEIRISDRLSPQATESGPPSTIEVLAHQTGPDSRSTTGYRCTFQQRGVVTLGPATASSAFPLGLVRTRVEMTEPQTLVVAPQPGKLRPGWFRLIQSPDRSDEQGNPRRKGNSSEDFFSLRSWQHGDSKRLVHWRSSAKRAQLLVRQGVDSGSRRITVLVDLSKQADHQSVETLASLATTLALRLPGMQGSGRLSLGIFGSDRTGPLVPGPLSMPGLMAFLATVQPAAETGIGPALAALQNRHAPGDQVVVFSNRSRESALAGSPVDRNAGRMESAIRWLDLTRDSGFFDLPPGPADPEPAMAVATEGLSA